MLLIFSEFIWSINIEINSLSEHIQLNNNENTYSIKWFIFYIIIVMSLQETLELYDSTVEYYINL